MVAIGNQWFWTYEVTKVLKLVIECYLVKQQLSRLVYLYWYVNYDDVFILFWIYTGKWVPRSMFRIMWFTTLGYAYYNASVDIIFI